MLSFSLAQEESSAQSAQRERRERTDNYQLLIQWGRTPEQRFYEQMRPVVLYGIPPAERGQETGLAESTLRRAATAFDTYGMMSLFRPTKAQREDHHRSLPVPLRQLMVALKAEYPDFTDVARSPVFVRFSLRDDDQVNIRSRLS